MDNQNILGIVALSLLGGYFLFGNNSNSSGNDTESNSGVNLITLPNGQQVPESQMPSLGYTLIQSSQGNYWISNLTLQQLYGQQTNNGNSNGGQGIGDWLLNNSESIINIITNLFGNKPNTTQGIQL